MTIEPGTTVTLHFSLALSDDNVIDSNFEKKPATFTIGDGKLLPGFEEALFGLKAGDKQTVVIEPEKGFGQSNPNNVQEVKRDQFATDMALEKGLVVSFADAAGGEMPGVISEFNEQTVFVDFNHPLAGRDITFSVHIIDVQPATTH